MSLFVNLHGVEKEMKMSPKAQSVITAALAAEDLSYEDRVKAIALAAKRLKSLANDPAEQLAARLVSMITDQVGSKKMLEDIGTDVDLRAIELEVELREDQNLRRSVIYDILGGKARDLTDLLPLTIVPTIREIVVEIVATPELDERKMAARALADSIEQASETTKIDKSQVLIGVVQDLVKAGIEPTETYSPVVMALLMRSVREILF